MSAQVSTNSLYVQECECASKHRFVSNEKSAGEGVICQDDGKYHYVGMVTQGEEETYAHAKYRALLTKFERVN